MWQGTGDSPAALMEAELPKEPAMASEGPVESGASSFLGALEVEAVEPQGALFGMGPNGEEAHWPSIVGKEALGEGGADPLALWTLADTRSTSWLAGVPTIASSSSWSPSHTRQATYIFILAAYLRPWNEKNKMLLVRAR